MDLLILSLGFVALFSVALGVSYLLVRLATRKRGSVEPPAANARLRVRTEDGVYRSRFIEAGPEGWRISAPLQRDAYVPLRVGSSLVVEASEARGAMIFRTTILARDAQSGTFTLAQPEEVRRWERRTDGRRTDLQGVEIEGVPGELLDVSEFGARVRSAGKIVRGERVRLDFPWSPKAAFGWVLATEGPMARIRFEEALEMPTP